MGAPPDDSGRLPDGGGPQPPDSGIPDGAVCANPDTWELIHVPIDHLEIQTGSAAGDGVPEGVTIRVLAVAAMPGCGELARVGFVTDPSTSQVQLAAFAWQYRGDRACPLDPALDREMIDVSDLEPGQWTFSDTHPDGPVPGGMVLVRPCDPGSDCRCQAGPAEPLPWYAECTFDCECEPPAVCVWDAWPYGDGGICQRTCSVDADCPAPVACKTVATDSARWMVCDSGPRLECDNSSPCPPGYACTVFPDIGAGVCDPAMDLEQVLDPCRADCDCPEGYRCVSVAGGEKSCQIRCRTDADCPRGLVCHSQHAGDHYGQGGILCFPQLIF